MSETTEAIKPIPPTQEFAMRLWMKLHPHGHPLPDGQQMNILEREFANLLQDRDEWREQHDNLLNGRDNDLRALTDKHARERELLIYWLLRAYQSGHREGWEDTPSVDATMDGLLHTLANLGYDPNLSAEARKLVQLAPAHHVAQARELWGVEGARRQVEAAR